MFGISTELTWEWAISHYTCVPFSSYSTSIAPFWNHYDKNQNNMSTHLTIKNESRPIRKPRHPFFSGDRTVDMICLLLETRAKMGENRSEKGSLAKTFLPLFWGQKYIHVFLKRRISNIYIILDGIKGCMRIYCTRHDDIHRARGRWISSWQVQYILIQPEIKPSNIIMI